MKNKIVSNTRIHALRNLLALGLCSFTCSLPAADFPELLDGFDESAQTAVGTPRLLITDSGIGGNSAATPVYEDGLIRVEGTLAPARGQPGFVSLVLLLAEGGAPQNLSAYDGIEIRIRALKGTLSVLAASSEIQNFDYHATPITRSKKWQVIRVPFKSLKRVWSENTALNLETITSINFVAAGMQTDRFVYEIDSVGFYQD
jgi:hypothetical protein